LEALLAAPEVGNPGDQRADSDCTRGAIARRGIGRCARASHSQAGFRSMGRRRSEHFRIFDNADIRISRPKPMPCALHADRPASRGDRRIDADAPSLPSEIRPNGGGARWSQGVRRGRRWLDPSKQ
jgi:hypothetical protein